jgi:tRNA A37 threonylcarbamoyladenosine dehydratase
MKLTETISKELLGSSPEATQYEIAVTMRRLGMSAAKRISIGQVALSDLEKTEAYQVAKKARKKAGRQRLKSGGILYAEDARAEIDRRTEAEEFDAEEKQRRNLQRAAKKQEKAIELASK